jgi:hypothetical protein
MAIYDENGLLQRLIQKIRSSGIGGLTRALDVREFLTDLINTMFSLFTQSTGSSNQELAWDPNQVYDLTVKQFAIYELRIFQSKIDNNINHQPPSEPDGNGIYQDAYWFEVSAAPKSAIQEYQTDKIYIDQELTILHYSGQLIRLDAPRPFLSTNVVQEIEDGKWKVISGGGNSDGKGIFEPVQDITELKAINTANAEIFPDKWVILVEDEGAFYRLDRNSSVSESLPMIIAPTIGTGRWIQDQIAQLQGKADKITGGTTGNFTRLKADGGYEDAGVNPDQFLEVSDIDVSSYQNQEVRLLSVKNNNGVAEIGTPVELLDNYLPESAIALLSDSAAWGNVVGKSSDYIRITGDNRSGGLGQSGQWCEINGTFIQAISHVTGTTAINGECIYVRNQSRDALDSNIAYHAEIISRLENSTGWDGTTQVKIISDRKCRVGSWYINPTGNFYLCFSESSGSYYWKRILMAETFLMQITNTALIAEIEAHDFTIPMLTPVATVKGVQGQVHCWENPAGTPNKAECHLFGVDYKWIKTK